MGKKNVHVVPRKDGDWSVKREGAKRSSAVTETQAEAIKEARKIAQKDGGEMSVHGKDGQIREKSSYGNDPCPPKDKA